MTNLYRRTGSCRTPAKSEWHGHPARDSWARRPCHEGGRGFTLLELLVVIGIIALLTGILLPVVTSVTARARQTKCKSNLRQFAVAINVYRADHRGRNPDWLSTLYPEYIDTKEIYICPADPSRGADGGKPESTDYWDQWDSRSTGYFPEAYDIPSDPRRVGRNNAINRCSYFYEFNAAECTIAGPSGASWNDVKMYQLRTGVWSPLGQDWRPPGPNDTPYSESRLPIIRCYHHWNEGQVSAFGVRSTAQAGQPPPTPQHYRDAITLNVGYAGNIFVAPLTWEHRIDSTD